MREIKFRFVDDTDTIYGPLRIIDIIEQASYCTKHPDAIFAEAKDKYYLTLKEFLRGMRSGEITVEQYIGDKDRYGHEVCEGDILWDEADECYWKVTFEDGEFRLKSVVGKNAVGVTARISGGSIKYSELAGNIHENPELLKGVTQC